MTEAGTAPRVLLIDSNVYFVKRMTDALMKEGFQVIHHPVASYALTMIEWNTPDIILCATELREMGAFEIVPVLRSDTKTAAIPLMALATARHKVLFGSNHPAWPAADCLADLAGLQLDDQTTDLFLHGNAERVFGLTSARPA